MQKCVKYAAVEKISIQLKIGICINVNKFIYELVFYIYWRSSTSRDKIFMLSIYGVTVAE